MNFIDSAIHLLSAARAPIHVDELCRMAVEQKLLDKVGKTPLRSMKGRLTTELKRGDDSRVERVEKDVWQLRGAALTSDEAEAAPDAESDIAGAAEEHADAGEVEVVEAAGPKEIEIVDGEPNPELEDVLAPTRGLKQSAITEVPDDDAAVSLYADESSDGPLPGLSEYRDELTDDEDRPMLPEIVARRDRHRRPPNERGRKRRERGGRRTKEAARERREREGKAREPRKAREVSAAPTERVAAAVESTTQVTAPVALSTLAREGTARYYLPGNEAGDGAALALRSVSSNQSVQVKQLAEMMRKRGVWGGDVEGTWPALKAALIADESSRQAAGLQPLVSYQGRDLFRLRSGDPDEVAAAASVMSASITHHALAVHRAIAAQLSAMTCGQFEGLAHTYLLAAGYSDIEWVKRVEPSAYAMATSPHGVRVLVGARSGASEVDRRGVGELRTGVEAKDLDSGLLLAPTELSEAATAELSRGNRPVVVKCGDALVAGLVSLGVGVVPRTVTLQHFDTQFFHELTRG